MPKKFLYDLKGLYRRSSIRFFVIFSVFDSVSDNKWTVSGRVTGSLLSRLDRINIVVMKNKKIKNFFICFFSKSKF